MASQTPLQTRTGLSERQVWLKGSKNKRNTSIATAQLAWEIAQYMRKIDKEKKN
jgi:hypothetical protein